jgi:hypothetical protein
MIRTTLAALGFVLAAGTAQPATAGQFGDWLTSEHGGECGLMTVGAPDKLHVLFRATNGVEAITPMTANEQWHGGALSMTVDGSEVAALPMVDMGDGELIGKFPPSLLVAMVNGKTLHAEFWEKGKQAPTMQRDVSLFSFDRAVLAWHACTKSGAQ